MQGGIEGEEGVEWIFSSSSGPAEGESAAEASDSSESSGPGEVHLAEIAEAVLQQQRQREELARRVARAGGIELVAPRAQAAAPPEDRVAVRARERERRQLEIARRFREARRQAQNQQREERRQARAARAVDEFGRNIRAAAKRVAARDPVQRRLDQERASRSPRRDRDRPTRN